ncbi:MAG: IPT/TIG domain-containing protein [Roseiflexaceae bacterium]
MRQHHTHTFHLIALLSLALLLTWATPTHAAQPGEELANSSGSLSAGLNVTIPIYSPEAANIRLQVGGGPSDTITMALRNGGMIVTSWVARGGETIWGFATIPSGGSITLQNNSGVQLTYALNVYARGVTPTITVGGATWSGVARGGGIRSAIQLSVPSAGRYRLTFGASGGSFQLKVDSSYILKTVVPGSLPTPTDSVYYLSAGIHTFTIVQNTADTLITWSATLAAANSLDALPSSESSAVLGGAFREEWVPIQVAAGQPVNLRIAATGAAADNLAVELYNGATRIYSSTNVFGGEVAWGSSALAAGANRLHVVAAAGNGAALAYAITLSPIAQPAFTWSGTTYGNIARPGQGSSSIKLNFPAAGLYRFTLGASSGRYQLMLDSQYLQKIVTDTVSANLTAFVPAGVHTLVVKQDPAKTSTAWSVQLAMTTQTNDSLPFGRGGGTLGGVSNIFREDWLPLRVTANAPINLRIIATGAASDSLKIELYNGATLGYSAAKVYGGETFWASAAIKSGTNRLHLVAASGNAAPMSYQIEVRGIASIPSAWAGVALSGGLNSVVQVNAPVSGVYDVALTLAEGSGQVLVDASAPVRAIQAISPVSTSTTLRVPLSSGLHTFTLKQDSSVSTPRTIWQIAASLRQADASLAISSVSPSLLTAGQQVVVTITGQGFESGIVVQLIAADSSVKPSSSIIVNSTTIKLTVPASTPAGTYSLRLTNPGGGTATKSAALSVGKAQLLVYLPLTRR